MAAKQPRYGSFESQPARFNDHEAYVYQPKFGKCHRWERSEVRLHAALMSKAEYQRAFGDLSLMSRAAYIDAFGDLPAPRWPWWRIRASATRRS